MRIFALTSFYLFFLCACSSSNYAPVSQQQKRSHAYKTDSYICHNAQQYKNKVLGNGECVDLIKLCANAPYTKKWKKGANVFGRNIAKGTAIATFKRGKYPNKSGYHAAIYSHQNKEGIFVWDQWRGRRVHLRFIRANQPHKKPGNNASRYSVIEKQ